VIVGPIRLDLLTKIQKNYSTRITIDLPDRLQGLRTASTAPPKHQRSELPVARAATGRTLPALTNAEIQRILDREEGAGWQSRLTCPGITSLVVATEE
jgi:hypothetical protein